MKKLFIVTMLPLWVQAQTLDDCMQAAEKNYPLIRQYDLIGKTTELTVANMAKGWLPQVSATAQATWQSDVVAWPDQMQAVYRQMGLDMKGLRKDQYRVGIDVSQMVFDGGATRSRQETARRQGAVEEAQTETALYQVRHRVSEMYFSLLLLDEQMRLNSDLQELLLGQEKKLDAMFRRGTAAESDFLAVKAERLNVRQQGVGLLSDRNILIRMLSAFCGMEVKSASKPACPALSRSDSGTAGLYPCGGGAGQRPELRAIDAQLRLADAQERSLDADLMPKLSVFASGFYGYPGYNMFADMMNHRWSLNTMIGARLQWNIGALYTRKNDKAKLQVRRSAYNVQRDVFLFDNNLEQIRQNEDIERYRLQMEDDAEIIALRSAVRKAAESKLAHGIIDVNDLLREIHAENSAKVQQTMHEVEALKAIYDLKFAQGEK